MTAPRDYDYFKSKTLPELAKLRFPLDSPTALAQLVYEEKIAEQQNEYVKEQIELQHLRNTELVKEQVRWIKYSAFLTALSTLTAAIAGACLSYMLTRPSPQQTTKTETQQETAQSTRNTTLGTLPGQKPYKVPSSPPK